MTVEAAVVVDHLSKRYGERAVVDDLSFTVAPGEVFGLLGPNGAGKTTTVEILEGFRRPDAGSVQVLGLDPWRDGRMLKPRVGVMLQDGGLYPGIKAHEVLRQYAGFFAEPESPESLLELMGLTDVAASSVRRLSGGQRQRLALALALVGRPELVFLDEPTAGMDPHARSRTWELVRGLADRGATVLLTTHFMDEAERLCDRVAIVDQGCLVALGAPGELGAGLASTETRFSARAGLDRNSLAGALAMAVEAIVEDEPGQYRIAAEATPALVADLACWLRDRDEPIGDLRAGRRSLEEVFLRLTNDGALT